MTPATWENCRTWFTFDGGLVDLLVPGTGDAHWERFFSALKAGPFPLAAFRDGEPIPLPESVSWIWAEQSHATIIVSITSGPITANCFFWGGVLELDIDPREVTNEAAFNGVKALMRYIAANLQLPVFAAPEGGAPVNAFLQVLPNGRAVALEPCP